jgi:phosphopantothenoylcysteine decarboxylase/phosphopantothenate--cysteine ligase
MIINPIENKTILLGVTGSIAAYKAAELASKLKQSCAKVDVILTASAEKFIPALTFQSLTGRKAFTDSDLWGGEGHVVHINLGRAAELMVVAPASANTISKMANGMGDNLLSVTALVAVCPILIAPAMDAGMYAHPSTQANVEKLRQRGSVLIGPADGHLASGLVGVGRMAEPSEIIGHIRFILSRSGPLAGYKVVVTAGGTQEPIDPVRIITNRSSGRQGFAIAQAALDAGAEVVLISGSVQVTSPFGCQEIKIHTAAQMLESVIKESENADVLIMAAAVADFRPVQSASQKIKKETGIPNIQLEPTADILAEVASRKGRSGYPRFTVGFAAETQDLLVNAQSKLDKKKLDMIIANDITADGAGFEVGTNKVTILHAGGPSQILPILGKSEIAAMIIQLLYERIIK